MTINANLGLSPWDVFHQGLSNLVGITIGRATILVGFLLLVLSIILGQTIGWSTLICMILVGVFIDFIMFNNFVPTFNSTLANFVMLLLGLLLEGYGVYIYLSAELGAGPRDGVMVGLTKKTGKSIRFIKSIADIGVVSIGYILGGNVGIGTLTMALFGGQLFQVAFKSVKFDINNINHRYIQDDIKFLKEKLVTIKEKNPS
jgi:uncharacterized membrane protein YczE